MNRRTAATVWSVIIVGVVATGCGRTNDQAEWAEVQRVKAGMLDVVVLSSRDGLHRGKDTFIIEFRSADGSLVDVGTVRGTANMPMAGMPMLGSIEVKKADRAGRYQADGNFQMAGTWRVTIEWEGPAGPGSVTFPGTVR